MLQKKLQKKKLFQMWMFLTNFTEIHPISLELLQFIRQLEGRIIRVLIICKTNFKGTK